MDINIKAMKPTEWKKWKEALEESLKEVGWGFSRIVRTEEKVVTIEGGRIPIYYNIELNISAVWNKCSRHTGGYTSVESLIEVKEVLEGWRAGLCNIKEN